MIDGGLFLFLLSILFACGLPAGKAIAARKAHREHFIAPAPLSRAFPLSPPSPSLEDLARAADDAIERVDLARGVASTAETYPRAARRRG